jgi:hypothetical protein
VCLCQRRTKSRAPAASRPLVFRLATTSTFGNSAPDDDVSNVFHDLSLTGAVARFRFSQLILKRIKWFRPLRKIVCSRSGFLLAVRGESSFSRQSKSPQSSRGERKAFVLAFRNKDDEDFVLVGLSWEDAKARSPREAGMAGPIEWPMLDCFLPFFLRANSQCFVDR